MQTTLNLDGAPIVWPEPTHGDPKSEAVKSKRLKPWRTAAECIDWSLPCPSIFERSRPLADATMRRIAKGIMRYVVNSADPFIVNTITASGAAAALVTSNLVKLRGTSTALASDEPLHTVSAQGTHFSEVRAFLTAYYGTDQDPKLCDPLHTVTTRDRYALVTVRGQQYAISDIGLRMLAPRELFTAQGFPLDYIIEYGITPDGKRKQLTKTAQVRMCGNSVSPYLAEALVRANLGEMAIRRAA